MEHDDDDINLDMQLSTLFIVITTLIIVLLESKKKTTRIPVLSKPISDRPQRGLSFGGSSSKRRKKNDTELVETLVQQVTILASIQNTVTSLKMKKQLSKAIYNLEGFEFQVLDAAFNILQSNVEDMISFIAKSTNERIAWMTKFELEQDN